MRASPSASTRSTLLSRTALCGVAGGVLLAAANPTAAEDLAGSATAIGHVSAVTQTTGSATKATITTAGSNFTITPNATRSIIDWDTFKVDTGQNLTFAFAAGGDIAVNRVGSGQAQVLGALAAKVGAATGGNVWILAPGGIVFGASSVTTVGGLFASTASLKTDDTAFVNGSGTETHGFGGAPDASTITVAAGASLAATGHSLALIAPVIDAKAGSTLSAPAGTALLAAAQSYKVTFQSSAGDLDLVSFEVDPATVKGSVSLAGATTAGDVWIAVNPTSVAGSVISLGGLVTATKASGQDGDIILTGGGGKIDASGATAPTGAATDVTVGTAPVVGGDLMIATLGGVTSTVDLAATGALAASGGTLSLKGVTAASAKLDATTAAATIGKLKTTGDAEGSAVDVLTIASVDVGGALSLKSALDSDKAVVIPGAFKVGGLLTVETPVEQVFKGFTDLFGKGTNADIAINLTKNAAKTFGDLDAGTGSISIKTVGDLTTGDLTGKGIVATTKGALEVGKVDGGAGSVTLGSGTTLKAGDVTGKGVSVVAGGVLTVGDVDAGAGVAKLGAGADFASGVVKGAGAEFDITGDLAIDGAKLTTGAGGLTLGVTGATTAATALTVTAITGQSGSLDLGGAGNSIGALTALKTTTGELAVTSTAATLTVSGGLGSAGKATVDVGAGALNVSGAVDTVGLAKFTAGEVDIASSLSTATTGGIEFNGPVALKGAATVATGGALKFDGTIGGAKDLTLNGASVVLGAAVGGGGKALTSLSVTGAATLSDVTTTGGQSYGQASLPGDVTLTSSGGGDIKFTGAVDSTGVGAHALAVSTTGLASFGGALGGSKGLSTLAVTAGTAGFGAPNGTVGKLAVKLTAAGDLAYKASGDVAVDAFGGVTGVSTANGKISLESIGGKLTLNSDVSAGANSVTLLADGGKLSQTAGKITAATLALTGKGGVDVEGPGNAFTALGDTSNSGAGDIVVVNGDSFTVTGAVKNTAPLGSIKLTTEKNDITISNPISTGPGGGDIILQPAGALKVGSDLSAGRDLALGDVVLTGDAGLSAGRQLTLGKLDGGFNATLTNGTTAGSLTGAIGTTPLTSLAVKGDATFSGGAVNTTGLQSYTGGTLTLGANTTLTSTGGAEVTVTKLASDATPRTLSFVTNGGVAVFKGAVDAAHPLQSVSTDGAARFDGAVVVTKGDQTYDGAVAVAADSALESLDGGTVTLAGTLDAASAALPAPSLAIDVGKTTGAVKVTGPIGASNPVGLGVRAGTFTGALSGQHLSTIATDLAGGLTIANAGPLTVGKVTAGGVSVDGITTQGQAVSLSTTSGALALNAPVSLNGGALTLDAASAITQAATGIITAASVSAIAGKSTPPGAGITLGADNNVATVSKLDGAAVTYVSAFAGVTDFQNVSSTTANLTTKAGDLNVGVGGVGGSTVKLSSSAAITETGGAVAADDLFATAKGGATLDGGNNVTTLDQLVSTTGQALVFKDVHAGKVGVDLVGAGGVGSATTLSFAGDADFTGTVNASGQTLELKAGKVTGAAATIKAGTLKATSAGGLDFSGASNAIAALGDVTNTGGGAVKISTTGDLTSAVGEVLDNTGAAVALDANSLTLAGVVKADTLTGVVTQDATFSAANLVSHLGDFTADTMTFTSAGAIDVSGALKVANTKVAAALTLAAGGAITQGAAGTVSTPSLQVVEATSVDLSRLAAGAPVNAIGSIASITVSPDGAVSLASKGKLTLADGAATIGATAGAKAGAVTLVVAGAISAPAAGILAKSLTGSSVGDADFSGPNHVDELKGFTTAGGTFTLNDLDPLTVSGTVTSKSADGLTFKPLQIVGQSDLTLKAVVDAGDQTLTVTSVTGAIAASDAILTAQALTGSAAKGAVFDNPTNRVATLGAFETNAGGVTTDPFTLVTDVTAATKDGLTTLGAFDLKGLLTTHGGDATVTVVGGAVTLDADIAAGAGAVKLTADGALTQTQPFKVTAGQLDAEAGGALSLTSENEVADLTRLKGTTVEAVDHAMASRLGEVVTNGAVTVTADNTDPSTTLTLYKTWSTAGDVTLLAKSGAIVSDSKLPPFTVTGDHVKIEAASLNFADGSASATAGATVDSGKYKDVDALQLIADSGSLVFGAATALGGTVTATTPVDLTLATVKGDIANLNAATGTLSVLTPAVIGTTYNAVFNDYVTGGAALHPTFIAPEPGTQTFNIDSRNKAGFAYATLIAGPDLLNIKTAGPLSAGDTSAITAITFDVAGLPAAPGGATFNGVVQTTGGAASTVDIKATGAIAEAGAGAIKTAILTAKSVGGMKLDGANVVPTLKALVNTGSGAIFVNDGASAVTLQTLTPAGDVTVNATTGSLTLAMAVPTAPPSAVPGAATFTAVTTLKGSDIASGGPLKLTAGSSIAFTGAVTGSTATVKAGGDAAFNTLTSAGELNVDNGGAFTATSAQGGSTVLKSGSVDVATLNGGTSTQATVAGLFHVNDFTTGDATITAGAINVSKATAGGSFTATAGDTTFGSLSAGGLVLLKTGALTFDTASSGGTFDATSTSIKGGQLSAGGALTLTATGAITLDAVKATAASTMTGASITVTGPFAAGGKAAFKAAGALTLATATAGTDFTANAGSFTADTVKAGGSLTATVAGLTKANALEATKGDLLVKTGSFTVVSAKAGQDATFTATGAGKLDTLIAGRDGALTAASLALVDSTAGRNLTVKTGPLTATSLTAKTGDLKVDASTADVKTSAAGGAATLTTTGAATYGDLSTGGDATVLSGGDLGLATAEVGGDLVIQSLALTSDTLKAVGEADVTATSATIATLTAGAGITVGTSGDATIGQLVSGADTALTIGGGLNLTAAEVGHDLTVTAAAFKAETIDAKGDATLAAVGTGEVTTLTAAGNASLTAATLTIGDATAGANLTTQSGPLTATSLTAKTGDLKVDASTADVATAHAGGAATLTTTGSAAYGDLSTGGDATVTSGGALGLTTAEIGGDLVVKALSLTSGTLKVGDKATLTTTAGDLAVKSLSAGSDVTLTAAGSLGFTTISSTSGGVSAKAAAVAGGTMTAGATLDLASTGAATLTQAQSGGALTVSAASLTAGPVLAGGAAKITTTQGDATITTLAVGGDLDLTAAGVAQVGALDSFAPGARLAITGVDVTLGAATGSAGAANTLKLNASAPGALTLIASRDARVNLTGPASLAAVTAGRTLSAATQGGDLAIVAAQAGDTLALTSDASIAVRSTVLGASGRSIDVDGGQDVRLGTSLAGAGPAQVVAPTGALLTFKAGRDLLVGLDTGFTANTLTAGRDLILATATGDVALGSAQAGRALALTASTGRLTAGGVTTTGLYAGAPGSNVTLFGNTLAVSAADAAGDFAGTATTGEAVVTGAKAGGDLTLTSSKGLASLNSAELTGSGRTLTLTGASAVLGRGGGAGPAGFLKAADAASTVVRVKATGGDATVDLPGDVRLTRVDATGGATVTTGGALTLGDTAGVAGGATVGGDATFASGGALAAANLQAGGDAKLTASSGLVTTSGTVAAGRNLALVSTSDGVTINGAATAGAQALIDAAKVATIATLRAPTVRVLATDLTLSGGLGQAGATVSVESRGGALTVGDGVGAAGLVLDAAESRRVTADKLDLYAGSTTGAARGDAKVGDLAIDPSAVKSLSVLAGAGQKVVVSGKVTTTTDGAGAFSVGRAPTDAGVDAWTPQDVTVTGAIGKATAVGTRSFSAVAAIGTVSLNARDDVLIGTQKFVDAIGTNAGSNIDITKGVPTGVTTLPEDSNRIFVAAGTLSLSGAGRIVQQSTGIQQAPVGIYLTNPGKASSALKLTGLGVVQPSVIDLSLSFFDGSGTLLSEQIAASSAAIGLAGGLNRSNSYRVNGCAIGASQQCTPTTSTVVDVRPSELVQTLVLTQAETPIRGDPTITGAGNEEIWRNAPTSLSDDSDDRRAKSTGSPPAPAPAPASAAAPPPEH